MATSTERRLCEFVPAHNEGTEWVPGHWAPVEEDDEDTRWMAEADLGAVMTLLRSLNDSHHEVTISHEVTVYEGSGKVVGTVRVFEDFYAFFPYGH